MLLGCDFSSAPTARKPIRLARGQAVEGGVALQGLESFTTLEAWCRWLADTPAWVGAFDLPFGLPRELVERLGWPTEWRALLAHYATLDRRHIREAFAAFCMARPAGAKFAHRATDGPAGSSPSMKWVNPPVALMLHAGVPRLVAAGAALPGLYTPAGTVTRIALEGYPGLLARELIGRRSYKSDDAARQTDERRRARADLLDALERGSARLGLRLVLTEAQRTLLVADARADALDATLCLVQAAWAAARRDIGRHGWGLPAEIDPLEGWIVSA
ncbi:DUF429 domain-containing protein [Variovorax defluvii]|uniref:DUF429 domain-containing protein n=1 Tax=Variovorax defluvii TaxID=913761 RepID=UPI0031EE5E2A